MTTPDFVSKTSRLPQSALASPGRRLAGHALDGALAVFTLFVPWLIWSMIVWKDGQTPAKSILKMRVVHLETARTASWGRMAVREILGKLLIFAVIVTVLPVLQLPLDCVLLFNERRRQPWDFIAGTVVVYERDGVLQ